jgi:polysaccharide deacetylase family protein (PEP-CTERM system associated)
MNPDRQSNGMLFSIDLEEFYPADPGRSARSTPLPQLVDVYLNLLRRSGTLCTFFVVGEVARRYPGLLREIASAGHELACHGDRHLTLEQFTPASFAEDLKANRAAVEAATGTRVQGFRAPLLSLCERTSWAHAVLAGEGFAYSSSVLPAENPLYGWQGFGFAPRRVDEVLEIPVTLARFPVVGALPLCCGTYFRVLPWWLIRRRLATAPTQGPWISYFHPYDIDHRQPWTLHAGVRRSRPMNALLFLRRASLPGRIERLLAAYPRGGTYGEYASRRLPG